MYCIVGCMLEHVGVVSVHLFGFLRQDEGKGRGKGQGSDEDEDLCS